MRYQIVGENDVEAQVLASMVPRPILDTVLPQIQARSIQVGVRLGVFEAIGKDVRTADEVASARGLNAECVELLLRVLSCAGYVERSGGAYRLTELSRGSLLRDSPAPQAAFLEFNYLQGAVFDNLEAVVRTGRGMDFHQKLDDPADWDLYQRAMLDVAQISAPRAADLMPIKPGARSMLDLAGGHGLYGAMMCRRHPPMRSQVVDLPPAVEAAQKLAREAGFDDVVTYRAGDLLEDDLGHGHDAAFIANAIHHFTPDQIRRLLRRAYSALTPGGTIGIWDMKRPGADSERELGGDGWALIFRVTSNGQAYTIEDFSEWLVASGFVDIAVSPTPFGFMQVLVSGWKPPL
jgi:ubiquinone/menaquinone biosynthesis C-methylase UbiE